MQDHETRVTIVQPQAGRTRQFLNSLVTFKATAADTNGLYSLFEIFVPPGEGMPAHVQHYDDEAFWVLEGTCKFLLGERELQLDVGAYAFVPRGTVHGYANSGSTTARMLSLITPGGIHERFFSEAGVAIDESPPRLPAHDATRWLRIVKIAQKYGIEMLSPPGI